MPSIKVLKANGELVEEFQITKKYKGAWLADDAMQKACSCEGDIIELPHEGVLVMSSHSIRNKVITTQDTSPDITYTSEPFNILTARKSLLSRAIKGNE